MSSGNAAGPTNGPGSSVNLTSQTSSLSSNPQVNEHAPELTFNFRSRRFQKMNLFWGTIVLMLLYVVFLALSLPLHWYCFNRNCALSPFSIVVYSNVAMWFITVVITFLVHLEFKKIRRRGYANFYKRNHSLVSDPFVIFSIGNAILLVYTWILHDTGVFPKSFGHRTNSAHSDPRTTDNGFDMAGYFVGFQVVVALEIIISFAFLIFLTARIIKFNGLAQPPDAINDRILSRSIEPRSIVGYNETNSNQDLVIDRQIDNINFLKRRCRLLYGSVKKLLSAFPSDQRKQGEEMLRQYLDEHRDDDDDMGDVADINEYLGTGMVPQDRDDVPLIRA